MRNFLLRVVINAAAIAVTARLLPGITVANNDLGTLLVIGLIFGIVNALVKPVLILLTCPAVILSLGLFLVVINGVMLLLTASLVPDRLQVDGLGPAILGGLIMGIIGSLLEGLLGVRDERRRESEVIVVERR